MVCHTVRIPYKFGQTIRIRPFFDSHVGSKHCDEKAAKEFLNEDQESYFIGGGDNLDSIIVSDTKRYRKSGDGTIGDEIIDEQIDKLYSWLNPHKDRIIGLGTGNHEDEIVKRCSTNPTNRICNMLGVKNIGFSWLVKIILHENGSRVRTVVIRGHHGWGGGSRTQGADLTKYSRDTAYWEADVFLYGHVHRKQSDRIPRLGFCGNKLISKPKLMGLCGAFKKSLSLDHNPTFEERRGFPPTEIGGIILNLKPRSKWVKMWIDT